MATLDLRTSKICRNLDGRVCKLSDKKVGVNYPPMHPWCRSTTIAELDAETMSKLKRPARDPEIGKTFFVPGDMNYQEWYKKYVKGKPEAEAQEKAIKNRSADKKQYEQYKEVLGDDIPVPL